MQASQIPLKFQIPFANNAGSGYIRPVPQASQIGITPGAGSLTDGFPPVCFQPVGAGGVPPSGQDFNGLLNQITAWIRWSSAGGPVYYDPTFSASIGGYPQGAILPAAGSIGSFWISTVDNNVTDPDTGGAGWIGYSVPGYQSIIHSGADVGTADNLQITTLYPPISSYQTGMIFCIKVGAANVTTTPKLQVGSLGQVTIVRADLTACKPGDLIPNDWTLLTYDGTHLQVNGLTTNTLPSSNIVSFYSSSTFTVPAGVYALKKVRVWGAGGGGGGSTGSNSSSGGGGGGYAEAYGVSVVPGQVITVTVGAGGAGGAGATYGSSGGTSTFASTMAVSATGGGGGSPNATNIPGTGGSGSGAQLTVTGQQGGISFGIGSQNGCGFGGAAPFGGGIPTLGLDNNGALGLFPGGGANGGSSLSGSSTGGTGANGLVLVEY